MHIGVDIGGNHVGIGIVNENGVIKEKQIFNYANDEVTVDDILNPVKSFIKNKKSAGIKSIGIGIPGITSGTHIDYTCNLPLSNIDVTDYIKTSIPIYMSNDANCATIAEYEISDKKFYSNYALVTVGTGIGAGMIINGNLYSGSTGCAGELGHMIIERDGLKCRCGRNGCFEQYASVSALKRMIELDSLDEIFYLSERNQSVQKVLDEYLENLADGLANFINIFDLEMLVIGGGLADYAGSFMHKLKAKIISKMYNRYSCDLNIKSATLGNDAGIIGAAMLYRYD